jgi:hypothetical protein
MIMKTFRKAALLGGALTFAVAAGGCASGYYDRDGYYNARPDSSHYGNRYDRDRYDTNRDREDHARRLRVCDEDGDNCHWEYRRP